jgi:hypothetical protein
MMFVVGFVGGMVAVVITAATLYGLGGAELVLASCFVGFCGLIRVLIPSWSSSLDDEMSFYSCQPRTKTSTELAVDTFTIKSTNDEVVASCNNCPICLEEFETGEEVSTARKFRCGILLVFGIYYSSLLAALLASYNQAGLTLLTLLL